MSINIVLRIYHKDNTEYGDEIRLYLNRSDKQPAEGLDFRPCTLFDIERTAVYNWGGVRVDGHEEPLPPTADAVFIERDMLTTKDGRENVIIISLRHGTPGSYTRDWMFDVFEIMSLTESNEPISIDRRIRQKAVLVQQQAAESVLARLRGVAMAYREEY